MPSSAAVSRRYELAEFTNWGDYFWDDQIDDCKRNRLDVDDAHELELVERDYSHERATQLIAGTVQVRQTFDLGHLKAIHAHLFQDVYEWAGQLRATELVRPADDPNMPGHEFVAPEQIEPLAGTVFEQLGDPAELADRLTDEVVDALARTYSGTNMLHPFVEGNGRTQRIFCRRRPRRLAIGSIGARLRIARTR